MQDERVGRKSHTPLCFVCISILNRKPSADFFSYFIAVDLVKPIPARVSSYSLTRNWWHSMKYFCPFPYLAEAAENTLSYGAISSRRHDPRAALHARFCRTVCTATVHAYTFCSCRYTLYSDFTLQLKTHTWNLQRLCSWKHTLEFYSDFTFAAANIHLTETLFLHLNFIFNGSTFAATY